MNADVPQIDVIFVDEHDEIVSPIGVKGLGEIGVVGTAAAVANAIYHATGKRVWSLPITIDKLQGVNLLLMYACYRRALGSAREGRVQPGAP